MSKKNAYFQLQQVSNSGAKKRANGEKVLIFTRKQFDVNSQRLLRRILCLLSFSISVCVCLCLSKEKGKTKKNTPKTMENAGKIKRKNANACMPVQRRGMKWNMCCAMTCI
jgi:hypothetical protein